MAQEKDMVTDSPTVKLPQPGCVRVGPVDAVIQLVDQFSDESLQQVLVQLGLEPGLFEDPNNSISFGDLGKLMNRCATLTGLPDFGLGVGQRAGLHSIGAIGELARYATDVEAALNSMIMHVPLNDRGAVPTLTSQNGIARLGIAVYVPVNEGSKHIYCAALAILYNLLHSLCGEMWAASEIRFSHSQPDHCRSYQSFFRSYLVFNTEENCIVFPDRFLRQSLPESDIEKHRELMRGMANIHDNLDIDFLERVRFVLCPMIISKRCTSGELARRLSLHPRTMNRRLRDRGTSYRKTVGKIRFDIAKQLLRDTDITTIRISTTLGYADPSVFTNAFRRWSGMPPSEWRKQHKN